MKAKIAIVGSRSLQGYDPVYEIIDKIVLDEREDLGDFVLINGGEEGVDTMAAEVALARSVEYETVPLRLCPHGCNPAGQYCFAHSYEPRSREIADNSIIIYRIYDKECGASTCEVTARFGDKLGRKVVRIPIEMPQLNS